MCRQLLVWEGWGLGSGQSLAQSMFGAEHQTSKSLDGKRLERKESRTAFLKSEFSQFLTHTDHPCCKLRVFPISAPEIGCCLFGKTLFVGMKSDFASARRELFQRSNRCSFCAQPHSLSEIHSAPWQQQAQPPCYISFLGHGLSWESQLLFQIPRVLISVSWNIN